MCYANKIVLSKNKQKRLEAIRRILPGLFEQQERIGKNIARLREEEGRIIDLSWADRTDVPIAELLDNGFNQPKRQRELLDAWLKQFYLRTSGYNPETLQSVPQIMLYSKDDDAVLTRMAEGITKLCEVLKPIKEIGHDQGINYFDIFEHTLSEHGSWSLARDVATGIWHIRRNRFDNCMFAKLPDALARIRERFYYQSGDRPKEFQATA